jgi:hypothetical protein
MPEAVGPARDQCGAQRSIMLDAAGTNNPDGNALIYRWFFCPEGRMGIPGQPVAIERRPPVGGGGTQKGGVIIKRA